MSEKILTESILDFDENKDYPGDYDYWDLDPYINPKQYSGPYTKSKLRQATDRIKTSMPDIDNYLVPTDKEILHIIEAKKKIEDKYPQWQWHRKAGIAVDSITDTDKAIHYFITALAIPFPGYLNKALQGSGKFSGNFYRALGVLLYDRPELKAIKDRIPAILDASVEAAAKKAERAAKRQEKQATAQAQVQAASGTFDASDYGISQISAPFEREVFEPILQAGNDVHIKDASSLSMKSGRTGHGENLLQCTVIFNEGKPNEYKDTIKVKSLGNSMWSGPYVYTGSEFKNLPERQFVGWATRKLNQISDEVANSTTSATDTEDEEEVNVDDIVTAEEEKLGEAFDGPIKWTEAPYVEKDVPQDNYNLDSPEESMLLGAMDKTMNAIRDMEKWDNKGAVKNLNGADSKIVTVKNRLTKRINTGVGNGPVKEKKGLFGKKKINDSLKESAQPENYAIVRNGEITDTYNNLGEAKSMLYTIYDQIDAGVTLGRKRDYYIKAYDEDTDEVYGPIIESIKGSTKINIRESLNSFDIKTNNKYDLRNSYDSAIMTQDQKYELAKMISLNESLENIANYIEQFI